MKNKTTVVIGMVVCFAMMIASVSWAAAPLKGAAANTSAAKVQTTVPGATNSVIPATTTGKQNPNHAPIQLQPSNGTVKDPLTGLIWLKNANCFPGPKKFIEVYAEVSAMKSGKCGLTDGSYAGQWRIPKLKELQERYNNHQGFDNFQATGYWSITPVPNSETDPYFGIPAKMFGVGTNFDPINGNKSDSRIGSVWAVRDGT